MSERLGHVHFVNADFDRALRARTRPGRTSQKHAETGLHRRLVIRTVVGTTIAMGDWHDKLPQIMVAGIWNRIRNLGFGVGSTQRMGAGFFRISMGYQRWQ